MGWSTAQPRQSPTKFFHLSHLRRMKGCEQVAAVCYRVRGAEIEFLLVQTRGGRWTFPKGGAEPGLTHAQAAALEAFEEAGVHGRMEETAFTRYFRRKGGSQRASLARSAARSAARPSARSAEMSVVVDAHLCEVTRLESPEDADRNPTWFSVGKAKRRLREGRKPDYAAELSRVLDRAFKRIQLMLNVSAAAGARKDALQRVHLAAPAAKKALKPGKAAKSRARVFVIDQF